MNGISRRGLLKTGVAAGVLGLTGLPVRAQARGGKFTAGLNGANTSDSWDGRTHADMFMIGAGMGTVFDCLTENGADGLLKGELAESWEASPDAKVWTFNLRQGVTFHNGEAFDANEANALAGKFPLARFFYVYVNKAPNKPLSPLDAEFVKLVLSKQGQEVVVKDGYIPLPSKVAAKTLKELGLE